ncbi:MAG: kinase [Elusimicrobia bacterium RIFOXYA2_FULL_50_26]|nr:MAG: kinase [Elusimicrobia bacterium RIFOXYA2_FULL_50_26]OGS24145.1 MAG: kinase [Elusimicrobia bacterium RIFOXYB2_FULL_50_12]
MIITRTPFRISFFGGGTDYPAWFKEHGGTVLATTIDKYCSISLRYLPPFFEYSSRIVWSLTECVKEINDIKHPSVRECLKYMGINKGVEVHYDADLPARTGLGSSSSFTVSFLHSLYAIKGTIISKMQLAKEAIHVEQNLLKENVGCQDQILASFGGLNLVEFKTENEFSISPLIITPERKKLFHDHLLLLFTGFSRTASEIAGDVIKSMPAKKREFGAMQQMVQEGINILNGASDINDFGKLLHESWQIKRSLTNRISNPVIDRIYERALAAGATGGKILGAGGGGFLLIFARPELHEKIKTDLKDYLHIPFEFENLGSQVIFYTPETH